MDETNAKIAELEQLLWPLREGTIDAAGIARIETLVSGDAEVRRFYIRHGMLCGGLRWLNSGEVRSAAYHLLPFEAGAGERAEAVDSGQWIVAGGEGKVQGSMEERAEETVASGEWPVASEGAESPNPEIPESPNPFFIPQPLAPSPLSPPPSAFPLPPSVPSIPSHPSRPSHLFSLDSPLGSYLISCGSATVFIGILLLIFSLMNSPSNRNVESATGYAGGGGSAAGYAGAGAEQPMPVEPGKEKKIVEVGRITGKVDCDWGDRRFAPIHDKIVLGINSKFVLVSGLMEITYYSGAKVILQGPCTYEVDSAAGGYLSLGKLTARCEMKGERGEGRGERGEKVAEGGRRKVEEAAKAQDPSPKPEARNLEIPKSPNPSSNPQSPVPNPPSPAPLFAVRTPTAVVTDLGTEFGVEVDESGANQVRVFEGMVDCVVMVKGEPSGESQRLVAGQGVLLKSGKLSFDAATVKTTDFARAIPRRAVQPREVLAYWRFEDVVSAASPEGTRQDNVILDSSGQWHCLSYWPGLLGSYVSSSDVPPSSLFRSGFSGGTKSFNSSVLDPHKKGILFCDSENIHGPCFDFYDNFTIEGYFKTDGDQSKSGEMAIVFKDVKMPAYSVSLNRSVPGSVDFTIFGGKNAVSASCSDTNHADGRWHYFAARLGKLGEELAGVLSLLVIDADGKTWRASTATPEGFKLNRPNLNLTIGKAHPTLSASRHFRGLIDEVRISDCVLDDAKLLAPVEISEMQNSGTEESGKTVMERKSEK